ncbi:MAG: MgtC/SapB family protein [Oscillospiraceae bacterium]|nr:MgtC/SapB family protein [Oscillospiraceae bacterium]
MELQLREVTYLAVIIRIFASVLTGGLIGMERELKSRPAGLRTYMVVCLGACLVMLTNQYIFQTFGTGDPVRMGAQVVSGIGFLGAGTIMVTRRNQVKGLTTAAGLWTAAGVGLAIGIGFYEAALVGAVAVFLVMTTIQFIDNNVQRKSKMLEVYVELKSDCSLGQFLRQLREMDIAIMDIQQEQGTENPEQQEVRAYFAFLKLKKRQSHAEVLENIGSIPGVHYMEKI